MGKSRYYGLTGTKLNVMIGVLAGLDFLYVLHFRSMRECAYVVKAVWL